MGNEEAREGISSRISVVVVNWNGIAYLGDCLQALCEQTRLPDEVIVVDNASTDGSAELVAERFPGVRLVRSGANLGFAAGCNLGIRASGGDYVATLNPDALPDPAWLEALAAAMDEDDGLGACASLMLFADRPDTIDSAGIALDLLGIAWDRLGGEPVSTGLEQCEVFGACGGAALYRRRMLEQMGGFDEDFFMYLEDVDLAWRAQAAGWRCLYVPAARVYHAHSASLGEGSSLKNYLKARNKVWLIAKNYPWPQVARWAPLILLADAATVVFACSQGNWAALRGRVRAVGGLPAALRKRPYAGLGQTQWAAVVRRMHGPALPWGIWHRFAHLNGRGTRWPRGKVP